MIKELYCAKVCSSFMWWAGCSEFSNKFRWNTVFGWIYRKSCWWDRERLL